MENKISTIISSVAGIIQLLAFWIYNQNSIKGKTSPNIVSWGLWAGITCLNFTSYQSMSNDWVKSILPTASSFACIFTFAVLFFGKNKKIKLGIFDGIALIIGVVSVGIWFFSQSAMYANVVLQLAVLVGFIPTVRGVLKNPKNENPIPWLMWSVAYTLSSLVVFIRWHGQLNDLVYPIVVGVIMHTTITLLSLKKKK